MKKQQTFKKLMMGFLMILSIQACKKNPEELIKAEELMNSDKESEMSTLSGTYQVTPYVANGRGVTDGPISIERMGLCIS